MTTIDTTSGHLTVIDADGLLHARGIPYAVAERFEDPTPVHTPGRTRDATRRGPACVQNPSRLDGVNGPIVDELEQSEHCQVLSVTAPEGATDAPVMVWFHGGAYVSGGGESSKYDPDPLVREGVVAVTVTYRLGGFGYLTPSGQGKPNQGLKDQLAALHWVAANIGAFGGNPADVTLFGQSAGGDSILSLIAATGTDGLFRRAIVQSAPTGTTSFELQHRTAQRAFTEHLAGNAALAPAADILSAERAVGTAMSNLPATSRMPFHLIAGDAPLPSDIPSALRDAAPRVELLIGHTKDDAAPFVAMNPKIGRLRALGPLGRLIQRRIVAHFTDKIFGIDAMAELWREAGGAVATYRFDWAPEGSVLGANHCIELPFLFGGDWSDAPMLNGQQPPEHLAAAMRQTWTTFAKDGVAGLPPQKLVFA